ncbi:laminin subunit beta-3 [Aplochiton taeniatus]
MRIILLFAALTAVISAQSDCLRGACYPPTDDLLLGRGHQLHASSTCGLSGSEVFCTPLYQRKMKCCPCDSRNPSSPLAHTIQNVLSTVGPNKWWQSKKDTDPVTLQLDLHDLYQLDNLILTFTGPRPSALVVERTEDGGQTWQPAIYMATDCSASFPSVATTTPRALDHTYCYTLPSTSPDQYKDHTIEFSPLRQFSYVPVPIGQKIKEVSGLRGLRVRLTELGPVPRLPGRPLSQFFGLREMRVIGSCMCYGHANRCLPETSTNQVTSTQVGAQCECQHNTAGLNCERCADLYNDLPWRPAEVGNTHMCQRCECNNHAQSCHFDPAVYEASGRRSGGVCEGCMHHTTGPKCDRCAPGYQPNPRSRTDRPDACIRCPCSAEGTLNGGQCEDSTGSCKCKANVESPSCDRCRMGFYGLSSSNPLGCSECSCSSSGSRSNVCDLATGQCPCRPYFQGRACDQCSHGYWKPLSAVGCESCRCDPTNSLSDTCDQLTGQCVCRPGFGGRTCTECPDNTYGDSLVGCRACQCVAGGTVSAGCDKRTGVCLCRPGVTGARCDRCKRGHCDSFPTCDLCPSCFFTLDAQIRNITLGLEIFSPSRPSLPLGPDSGNLGQRIRALEDRLIQVQKSLPLPPDSARQLEEALFMLSNLRDHMDQVSAQLGSQERVPGLDSELDQLKALLISLNLQYNAKKDALRNAVSSNNEGAFSAIKTAYDESTDAAKSVENSGKTVDQSKALRENAKALQNQVQPGNIRDLDKLNQQLATKPDLTPTAKQVCGSMRTAPCTPSQCLGGDLCPAEGAPPCGRGQSCVGALPRGDRALMDAEEVKGRLEDVNGKITQAAEKIQVTQDKTNQVRQTTEQLTKQIKKARGDLEVDLKETREVINELKDFLSEPSDNLNEVQEVSEWILNAKLPLSLASLKRKLQELKDLAAGLPDSAAILKQAGPQLDTAKRLLKEAEDARDNALGVKADVDGLLEGFNSVEGSFSGLEDKVQSSMDIIDELNSNLTKVKDQLNPAEKALVEAETLTNVMKPQLVALKALLLDGGQLAQNATGEADRAKKEADAAEEELAALQREMEKLKAAAGTDVGGEEAGSAGERLQKLKEEAGSLAKDTEDMMDSLAGKADSLRALQEQVLQKSDRLSGLEEKLQDLLSVIQVKATDHSKCQA